MGVTNPSAPSSIPAGAIISVVMDDINLTLSHNMVSTIPPSTSINFSSPPPNVLVLSSASGATVGMGVVNNSNPSSIAAGTTIAAISGQIVTLSANVVSTVNAGDSIQCGNISSDILHMSSVAGIRIGMQLQIIQIQIL